MKSIKNNLFKKFEGNITNVESVFGGLVERTHAGLPGDVAVDSGDVCDYTDTASDTVKELLS